MFTYRTHAKQRGMISIVIIKSLIMDIVDSKN